MARAQVTVPLDIPDVRVVKTEINAHDELIITIESIKSGAVCHRCGQWIDTFHGHDDWVSVRHLPVFGRATYLRYRPKRYECQNCTGHPTTTQRLDLRDPNSPHTFAYDNHLLVQLIGATVEDVCRKEQVGYDAVLGVLERRIRPEVDWSAYTRLDILGLDEIALKKGHRDFVVIATARLKSGRIVILGVLPDRQKETVVEFLRSIPQRLKQTIQTVCSDMYDGYIEAVRQELKTPQIVIDRFHVTRAYRDGVDGFRKTELKRLKHSLSTGEYQSLKGSLWAFRKKREDLNAEERKVLQLLFEHAPKLKLAYDLQEQLTTIFDQPISKPVASLKIRAWIETVIASPVDCFDTFLKTLEHWWEEILNYFIDRNSSGFVEGFNNKLKVLKRRCYGIFNLKHLFQRLYLDLEGYRLFA
jgi:transposase